MRSYLFSILIRFYLAFSGFLVFLLTATLFGAEGRGIIAYGTSLFAMISIIFSANLGRTFLAATKQNEPLKRSYIRQFLKLNCLLTLAAAIVGIMYWSLSPSALEILSPLQAICFSATSLFYVWSINGNAFYASFVATKKQENIILVIRTCLILLLGFLYLTKEKSLDYFIVCYSLLLFAGSLTEILWLYFNCTPAEKIECKPNGGILKDSLFHHMDFLSFNIFPLFLTVLLASFVAKAEVGRFNFALQIINLIFLFSTTANIRLITYVSDVGFRLRMTQFKKLFWATLALSALSIFILSFVIDWVTTHTSFEQFKGAAWMFLICGLAVPGYILYQFFSPIWIEMHRQKQAAQAHALNFIIFLLISPFIIANFKLAGAVWLFALFHFGLILTQGYLYRQYAKN